MDTAPLDAIVLATRLDHGLVWCMGNDLRHGAKPKYGGYYSSTGRAWVYPYRVQSMFCSLSWIAGLSPSERVWRRQQMPNPWRWAAELISVVQAMDAEHEV